MVDGIGSGTGAGGMSQLKAELQRLRERAADLRQSGPNGAESKAASDAFTEAVRAEVGSVDKAIHEAGEMHLDALEGNLDFHEVAAKIKRAELSFGFALQVRNKLIDAYREVMRMSV